MLWNSPEIANLLPATVVAAIVLFAIKETLEAVRRFRVDGRKKRALRKIIARECELNYASWKSLKDAIEAASKSVAKDSGLLFEIFTRSDGEQRWQLLNSDREIRHAGPLRTFRKGPLEASALTVAELDAPLFELLEDGVTTVADLDAIRGSLANYVGGEDAFLARYYSGFLEWAVDQFEDAYSSLDALYRACTGNRLERARLR